MIAMDLKAIWEMSVRIRLSTDHTSPIYINLAMTNFLLDAMKYREQTGVGVLPNRV
jgi:hypothetical protein